jgi:hypothetical protein
MSRWTYNQGLQGKKAQLGSNKSQEDSTTTIQGHMFNVNERGSGSTEEKKTEGKGMR